MRVTNRTIVGSALLLLAVATLCFATLTAQGRAPDLSQESACQTLTPTAIGGPSPKNPAVIVLRWLGTANHELAYRDSVLLLDAHYDRGPRTRPIGFTRRDIKRATAIFVGHGHFDHVADAADVAERTGARVFGGPPTAEYLHKVGLPEKQRVTVKGGEVEKFNGFTVEAILAHHAVLRPEVGPKFAEALAVAMGEPTPEQKKEEAEIRSRGTSDPKISTEGTIAYLFTFDNGFRLLYLDSAGPITEGERQVMAKIKKTDLAIVSYQGHWLPRDQIAATLPLIKLFNPGIFIPTHHDETFAGIFLDRATYPLFMVMRDELPATRTISTMYRTPICVNTETKEVFVGGGSGM